jgi:hypothetical protein
LAISAQQNLPGEVLLERKLLFGKIVDDVEQDVIGSEMNGFSESHLKQFMLAVVKKLRLDLTDFFKEMASIRDSEIIFHRSFFVHRVLEDFEYEIATICRHASEVPVEIHNFIEYLMLDFERIGVKTPDYVLLQGRDLSTTNYSNGLIRLFTAFPRTRRLIESSYPFFWEIFLPPALIRNTVDWVFVIHEIGHMIESESFRIVDQVYADSIASEVFGEANLIKMQYSREFQADAITTIVLGPIFPTRTIMNYYTKEIRVSPTHPAWSERLSVMQEVLKEIGVEMKGLEGLMERLPHETPLIQRDSIENLPGILRETMERLRSTMYSQNHLEIEECKKQLERMTPFTKNVRILLNAAEDSRKTLINSIGKKKERERFEREFNYLLKDSIRLSYIRKIFEPVIRSSSSSPRNP